MARSRGTKEYLPPLKGLNTSLSPRMESEEFFTDGVNIVYREGPVRLEPRKGIAISKLLNESDAALSNSEQSDVSYGEWRGPNNEEDKSFLWVKVADRMYFIDVETNITHPSYVDLTDFLSGTSYGIQSNLNVTPLEAKNIKGNLLIVNPAIEPTLLSYDGTDIEAYPLELKIRDTLGIEDGLAVSERPASPLSEEHQYNLYNQGWHKDRRVSTGTAPTDPVVAFESDQGVYPSNADISHLAVVDDGAGEILFDSDFLLDLSFGSTPAPRGHYVFPAFNIDREERRLDKTITGLETGGSGGASDVVGNPSGPPVFPAPPYDNTDDKNGDPFPDYESEQ